MRKLSLISGKRRHFSEGISVRITGENQTNPNKPLAVASIIECEKLIIYIRLSSFS